jgi:hypothetical protein
VRVRITNLSAERQHLAGVYQTFLEPGEVLLTERLPADIEGARNLKQFFVDGDIDIEIVPDFLDEVLTFTSGQLDNRTTSDPLPTNDSTEGYGVGSHWYNTATSSVFICLDATPSAALWIGIAGGVGGVVLVAAEALSLGHIVAIDAAGEVLRAAASFSGGNFYAVGSARQAVLAGSSVQVATSGDLGPVRFSVAPLASANGQRVFLSTTAGIGSLTPPLTAGNVVFTVGVLQGADGITIAPSVLIQPQYVSRRP